MISIGRSKKTKFRIFLSAYRLYISFYLIVLIAIIVLLIRFIPSHSKPENTSTSSKTSSISLTVSHSTSSSAKKNKTELKGTYSYGTYVSFRFNGKGQGIMRVDDITDYDFKYTIKGDKLTIKYVKDGYNDTYKFKLKDNKLYLYGIGNTKGSYELKQ